MVSALPSQLGRYKILDEVGRGAMGVVYLARDPLIGRLLALKTFRISAALSGQELETFRARFIREAQSAGILSHPNIVTIHDVVEESEEGATFIAMEYVRGTDLKETLAKEGKLPLDDAVEIVDRVAEGLAYAHGNGVVHRDVKPANILITDDGQVKLTDFGIARVETSNLTMEGQLLGTPNYMAPEQIQGLPTDHRVDIFSLGVVLYEMLTGEKPFKGENVTVVTHRIVYDEYTAPEEYIGQLPEPVMRVLARALAKDPEARYADVAEMAEDLREEVERLRAETAMNETQAVAPVPPPPPAADGTAPTGAARPADGTRPGASVSQGVRQGLGTAGAALLTGARSLGSAVRRRSSGLSMPSPRRLALVAGAALVVCALLGGLLLAATADDTSLDEVTESTPIHRQRVAVHPHLVAANRNLQEGDPSGALVHLESAVRAAPDLQEVRLRRRQVAEQAGSLGELEARVTEVSEGLDAAREAASRGRWVAARDAANGVLEIEPENREAQELVARAEAGLERRAELRQREALEQAAREAEERLARAVPEPEPEPLEPLSPEPTGEAGLDLYFYTELSQGVLTIYVGDEQLLREDFRFVERRFLKTVGKHGEIEGSYTVKPGETTIRIVVALPDRPSVSHSFSTNLQDGSRQTLNIRLYENERLAAGLR